jgi:hypothetical protein
LKSEDGGEKMNKKLVSLSITSVLIMSIIGFAIPIFAKPTTPTVDLYQAQFQWRGFAGNFGGWTYSYQNVPVSIDYVQTGKVLHAEWDYSPAVSNQRGESTVYVYNAKEGLWIEKEGHVKYIYELYGDYVAVNYFRGYLNFTGEPSTANFVHGVAYQWIYILAPENEDVPSVVEHAWWDEEMNAWLVGFSIYLWDPAATQAYNPAFPDPFPRPVPANDYNPLGL